MEREVSQLEERLQTENEKLIEGLQGRRVSLGGQTEAEQLLEEQRQLHEDLQAELMEVTERGDRLEERCYALEHQITKILEEAELERLRAVEALRQKYDEREDRLLLQLQDLQRQFLQLQSRLDAGGKGDNVAPPVSCEGAAVKETANPHDGEQDAHVTTSEVSKTFVVCTPSTAVQTSGVSKDLPTTVPTKPAVQSKEASVDLSAALLAQQLPPLPKFSGGDSSQDESFLEWIAQFELVAEVCKWSEQAKLIHLTTRLCGEAFAFYRSCSKQQKASYDSLVVELKRRFTPVCIQSVQTSLFHDRKQGSSETVDTYAQDLKSLFHKAYPQAQQGSEVAESMGRSVLASQFVAGLTPALKAKVAGTEGKFEEILVKARFEEAKLRNLSHSTPKSTV